MKNMTSQPKSDWLSRIALFLLISLGAIALYKGTSPAPVRISPLTLDYTARNVFARATVTNDTDKPLTLTVRFEYCHSSRASRFAPPINSAVIPQEVSVHVDAHSSRNVSCEFPTQGPNEQNMVSALITKYQ